MASRRNPYHDPAIREGLNNIAAMFAPPSGADLAGYATANARRQEAEHRAWLFNNTADPTAAARSALLGIQNYQNTPSGFAKTDETTRRGQDVEARTKLEQERIRGQNTIAERFATPLVLGQDQTAILPQQTQRGMGLPQVIMGIQERKPGNTYALPDGTMAAGPAKPLSLDEAKAREFANLPPEQRAAAAFGNTPVETIIMNGQPRIVTRPDAIGQSPAPQANTAARKDGMALLPDGRRLPVTRDPSGLQWQMQDGSPVPPDTQVFDMARPQGTNEQLGITSSGVTEGNRLRAAVVNADGIIRDIDTLVRNNPAATGLAANIISFTQDLRQVLSEFGQAFGGSANADAPITPQQLQSMASGVLDRIAPNQQYNPVYRQARALLLELAYSNARMNNPSGEVSRFALEREIEQLGLGSVGNDQAVLAVLGNARNRLVRALDQADVLQGKRPGPTRESLSQPGAPVAPRPQGAPQAAPAAPQAPTRLRFDANGNQVQ